MLKAATLLVSVPIMTLMLICQMPLMNLMYIPVIYFEGVLIDLTILRTIIFEH
jgi:hypothetical protein